MLSAYDALVRDVKALFATNNGKFAILFSNYSYFDFSCFFSENLAASFKMASDYEVIRIKYDDSLRELSAKNAEIEKL